MEFDWRMRRDAERHPVRYLAWVIEQRTGSHFSRKQLGQLKHLHTALGEFTGDVIEWMCEPVQWWKFCQHVRAESGLPSAPAAFDIGFLLKHRNRALNFMRQELDQSSDTAHLSFCTNLDQVRYRQLKSLVCVYAAGRAEWGARIEAAHTVTDLQQLFNDLVDAEAVIST